MRRPGRHFAWVEFRCHDGTPVPTHAHDDVHELVRLYLEPLRKRWGVVHVNSGYRTAAYNRSVGGAPHSFHVYLPDRWGAAADVRCQHGTPRQWAATLEQLDPGGLGLYAAWVHVDNRTGRARW